MSAPDSTAQVGAGWDEAQCMEALAHLEQLQAQVNQHHPLLRNGIDIYRLMICVLRYPELSNPSTVHPIPRPSSFTRKA